VGTAARFMLDSTPSPESGYFTCHILDHEDHAMMGVLELN
jgi:FtsP/CotA-like multicopper oxidase with cupredoxin domain